jgi:predicted phage terminase large subunit-like protein
MQTTLEAIEKARTDLAIYASLMWPPFELARHHKLLVEELERVERGEVDRLMIFMPPRHGKSLLASTLFPAWYLGRSPGRSIIASSYGQELASDFGRRTRNFVADPMHRAIFPECVIADDSSAVHRFNLSAGGAYYAVGAGGPITGRGANLLLIDDPIKGREQAYSAAERRSLQQWYESVAYTRLQPAGAIVLIQTRWHQDDLAGWLLREHASENWRVISLPAIAEPGDLLGRAEGSALWPAKFPLPVLERIREAIGSTAWIAQYQQRPAPEEGAIFRRDWFLSYPATKPPECSQRIISLDTAFKTGESNDFSVIQVWGQTKTGYALLSQWRERAEFGDLTRKAVALGEQCSPQYVLIEDAASGQSLIQMMRSETRLPILPVKALGDKVSRAHAVSPLVESGRVFIPDSASWLRDFLDEVTSFPAAPHDDQVDAMTQALGYMREHQYEPYRYSGLPRLEPRTGIFARSSSAFRDTCEEMDRLEDAQGGATYFVTGQHFQRGLEFDRRRWGGLGRRKCW